MNNRFRMFFSIVIFDNITVLYHMHILYCTCIAYIYHTQMVHIYHMHMLYTVHVWYNHLYHMHMVHAICIQLYHICITLTDIASGSCVKTLHVTFHRTMCTFAVFVVLWTTKVFPWIFYTSYNWHVTFHSLGMFANLMLH